MRCDRVCDLLDVVTNTPFNERDSNEPELDLEILSFVSETTELAHVIRERTDTWRL